MGKLDPAEPMTFIDEEIMQVVTCYKVKKAFAKFGDDKTAGPDEIKPVVLKHFPASALGRITILYRASLQLGYMPQSWRLSTAIFIPKPVKNLTVNKEFSTYITGSIPSQRTGKSGSMVSRRNYVEEKSTLQVATRFQKR